MKYCIFILVFLLFSSCEKKDKNVALQEIYVEQNNILLEITDVKNIELDILSKNFPKIMYVISKEGLRIRPSPSLNGKMIGILSFGERIIIDKANNTTDTIDNITDCWYSIDGSNEKWVFGGYLSEYFPSDALVILGKWDDINRARQLIIIDINNIVLKYQNDTTIELRRSKDLW